MSKTTEVTETYTNAWGREVPATGKPESVTEAQQSGKAHVNAWGRVIEITEVAR